MNLCRAKYTFTYEEFQEESLKITKKKGLDIVFDSVAGEVTRKSLNCLKEYGKIVQFGNSSGDIAIFNNTDVHSSCRSFIGFSLGTTRKLRLDYIQSIATEVS
ncbi:zinc-binding dehydrogenase [Lysinibacillus xylanilyticus]|uniref:zinc-binding dehydrogenase n=1 Tax=Lysinibacillus xylanilyticus TaxID=582475 RepID=UPI003CFF1AAD